MKDKMTKCMTGNITNMICNTHMTTNGIVKISLKHINGIVKISLKHKIQMLIQILKWLLQQ